MVAVAGVPVWGLVGGFVAWQKLTPPVVAVAPSPPPPLIEQPPVNLPIELLPPPRVEEPVNPFRVSVAISEPKPVEIDPEVAEAVADGLKNLVRELFAGKREAPVNAEAERKPIPAGCKTHGTALHFVKGYDEAKKQAVKDGKLVLVLHLSGNIEDDGFT
jgi:hypothetical protein